jgi:hypothetical protein
MGNYPEQNARDAAISAQGSPELVNVTAVTSLEPTARFVRVTPSGSTYAITLPALQETIGAEIHFVVVASAVGEVSIGTKGDGLGEAGSSSDPVGDNLNDLGDYAILKNLCGLKWVVVKEVTT